MYNVAFIRANKEKLTHRCDATDVVWLIYRTTKSDSIAPASALEASRVASDLVLVSPDLSHVADTLRIGKSAKRRILENFSIAAMYNLVAVPVAFLGFATPLAAAIAMSTSSVIVSLNAMRTR